MDGKRFAQIALLSVAALAAGYFTWKNSREFSSENPEITTRKIWYLCDNAQCKNGFAVTVGESRAYADSHDGSMVPCPKCGSKAPTPAYQCPACQKAFPPMGHGTIPKNCPNCKAPLPRDLE